MSLEIISNGNGRHIASFRCPQCGNSLKVYIKDTAPHNIRCAWCGLTIREVKSKSADIDTRDLRRRKRDYMQMR